MPVLLLTQRPGILPHRLNSVNRFYAEFQSIFLIYFHTAILFKVLRNYLSPTTLLKAAEDGNEPHLFQSGLLRQLR